MFPVDETLHSWFNNLDVLMIRKVVFLLVISFFAGSIFLQVGRVQANNSPITGPITTPITFFNLTGEVTLKHLGKLFGGMKRAMPGEDVTVQVTGFFNKNHQHNTETDEHGKYGFQLSDGLYIVEVKEGNDIFFTPPIRVVQVKEGKVKKANFQGLVFP